MPLRAILTPRIRWSALALLVVALGGCQTWKIPVLSPFGEEDPTAHYVGLQPGYEHDVSLSQEIYNKVREARAQNSIVLQVVGDDVPLRVLPLPPGQQSVFVSDLLSQTGVQKKLGRVDAVLFRSAQGSIAGVRMEVQTTEDKRKIRPESDYALQPGDRLRVEKAANPSLERLVKLAVGN